MSHRQPLRTWAARPHLPRRTVRLRLTLLYGAVFVVSGALLLAITYGLVQRATDGVYTYRGPNGISATVTESAKNSPRRAAVGVTQIDDGNTTSPTESPAQPKKEAQRLEALAKQQHADQLHELLVQSAIALAVMTLISFMLGWLIAGRALRPIRAITRTARNITATNLHERIAITGPRDELQELGDTIDELLMRLERSFDAQRRFVANASHELRTPLARQRTIAQVALADPNATVASLHAAHERVLAAGKQQEQLIEALLTLTQSQTGITQSEPFDLAVIADAIVRDRASEATERGVQVHTLFEPANVVGDPRLAERLVTNLVDNALRHNHPGGRTDIATHTVDGQATLSITNDGPKVPASQLSRLFEPLQRLDPARLSHPDGHGLGLSIVQAIADAHHATITTQARPEGGLALDVRFPTLPSTATCNEQPRARRPKHDNRLVTSIR